MIYVRVFSDSRIKILGNQFSSNINPLQYLYSSPPVEGIYAAATLCDFAWLPTAVVACRLRREVRNWGFRPFDAALTLVTQPPSGGLPYMTYKIFPIFCPPPFFGPHYQATSHSPFPYFVHFSMNRLPTSSVDVLNGSSLTAGNKPIISRNEGREGKQICAGKVKIS